MTHAAKSLMTKALTTAIAIAGATSVGQAAMAGEYWLPSNAPITYKMANPADMMGFQPSPAPQYTPQQAQQHTGQNTMLPRIAPAPNPVFDPSRVDETLYSHQRVGKPYRVAGKTYTPKHQPRYDMVGTASWYGDKFHGKLTANGERYDKNGMTAAHKTLPLNSLVVVTNLQTGMSLTLRINDRGPFIGERIIDLSEAAAKIMGITQTGLGNVRVQYAGPADMSASAARPSYPDVQAQPAPQKQAMRPFMPAPAPMPAPKLQYQAPVQPVQQPNYQPYVQQAPLQQPPVQAAPQPQYQPLRDMAKPAPMTEAAPAPKSAELSQPELYIPKIMNPVSIVPKAALPSMPHAIPEAYYPPSNGLVGDDVVVTMTIKGPIHLADYLSDEAKSYLTPAVNRRIYKTVK